MAVRDVWRHAAIAVAVALLALPGRGQAATDRVTISATDTGVRIVYDLAQPTRMLAVGGDEKPPAPAALHAQEPGLAYENGRIKAASPFRRATLLIAPDRGDVDARYPLLSRVVGRGFVLFAPYVVPKSPFKARVAIGEGRFRFLSRAEAQGGYVVVGAVPRDAGPFRAITSTNSPAGLESILHERAAALLAFYTKRLRGPPRVRPTMIISYVDLPKGGVPGYRGDVTPNGIMLLRFNGTMTDGRDTARGRATMFLAHELVHLWNAPRKEIPEAQAWLHEGSADYLGWLAVSTLWPGDLKLERNVQQGLQTCVTLLRAQALMQLGDAEARSVRYPCGAVVQWVADVGIRSESSGRRDIFDLWAGLVGGHGSRAYDVGKFRSAATALAPRNVEPLGAILNGTGLERWSMIAARLSGEGAAVEAGPPTPFAIRSVAVQAIILSACSEMWGVGENGKTLFSDAPPSCPTLGGQVTILRAAGVDPMADPMPFYDKVRDTCARRNSLPMTIETKDLKQDVAIRCRIDVERPIPDMRVTRALPRLLSKDDGARRPH